MDQRTQGALEGGFLEIGVLADNGAGFTTQLHQAGLQLLAGLGGKDAAHSGGTGEVDLLDGRVFNEGIGDVGSVRGLVVDDVQATGGQTSLVEDVSDGPETARRQLAALENDRVSCSQSIGACAHAEDVGTVPGGDSQDDTVWLLEDQGAAVRCRGDGSGDCGNSSCNVAQHLDCAGEVEVLADCLWGAGFLALVLGELLNPRLHDIGRLQEDVADGVGLGLSP